MPMISFESGQLTDEIKNKLIMKLTDISSEVTGIPKELFFVSIRELPDNNIAVGGKTVSDLKNELGLK
mgnify:CR=1 FL=1